MEWPRIQQAAALLAREFVPEEEPKNFSSVFADWITGFPENAAALLQKAAAAIGLPAFVSAAGEIAEALKDAFRFEALPSVAPRKVALVFCALFLISTADYVTILPMQLATGSILWAVITAVLVIAVTGFRLGMWLRTRPSPPSRREFAVGVLAFALVGLLRNGVESIENATLYAGALSLGFLGMPLGKALVGTVLLALCLFTIQAIVIISFK